MSSRKVRGDHGATRKQRLSPAAQDDEAFQEMLNRHGFGFQYALRKHIADELQAHWTIEDEELPVQCNGKTVHIDLVLRHTIRKDLRIVAECKKPDPGIWYFVRTPFRLKEGQVFFENVTVQTQKWSGRYLRTQLTMDASSPHGVSERMRALKAPARRWPLGEMYGLGFPKEARRNQSPLEEAIAQVFRGASGLIERFAEPGAGMADAERSGLIVPVIFTTAKLRGSSADLQAAELATGKVPKAPLATHPWLWLRQNMAPEMKHSHDVSPPHGEPGDPRSLAEWTFCRFARCVGIVSASGIDGFLTHPSWKGGVRATR